PSPSPATLTPMLLPTFRVANVAVAAPVVRVTVSPATTPTRFAPDVFRVPAWVPSYTLLLTTTPVTVRFFTLTVWMAFPAPDVELFENPDPPVYVAVIVWAAPPFTWSWFAAVVYVKVENPLPVVAV